MTGVQTCALPICDAGYSVVTTSTELAAAGNYPEALRILQNLLDNDAERVIESSRDANLHTTVRAQVNSLLLETPELLKRYRDQEAPKAQAFVDAGDLARAETTRFLTQPGLVAAARLAQQRLDLGRFESARLTLQPILTHPDLDTTRDALSIAALAIMAAVAVAVLALALDSSSAISFFCAAVSLATGAVLFSRSIASS